MFIPLQSVGPQELDGAVEQLTRSSLELSEAISNLGALKVMGGVFIVFAVVMILIFLYQVLSTSNKINRIDRSMVKVSSYFDSAADKSIGQAQAQVLIRRAFNSMSQSIKYIILRTRIENHIDNKEVTLAKLNRLVNYEYAEFTSFIGNFNYDEKPLSQLISAEDSQIIAEFVIEQVYMEKSEFSVSTMDQATDILMNGLKLEYLKKI